MPSNTVVNKFSFNGVAARLIQALGVLRCSLSVSKSRLSALIYFQIGPIKKISFSTSYEFSTSDSRANAITTFLNEIKTSFPLSKHLNWKIGIEGSGILVRIIELNVAPGAPIENAILWEIKRYLPFAISSSQHSYHILEKKDNKVSALVVVMKKDFMNELYDLLEQNNISVGAIYLTSLQIAQSIKKKNYSILFQGEDFSFTAKINNKKLNFFQINHSSANERNWNSLITTWQKLEASPENVYAFSNLNSALTLPQVNITNLSSNNNLAKFPAISQKIPTHAKMELISLSNNSLSSVFSPNLLPETLRKEKQNENLGWKLTALFLTFQLLTPAIYFSLRKQESHLWSDTSYSTLPRNIIQSKKKLKEIEDIRKEIILMARIIKQTSRTHSPMLQSIARMTRPNMVLSRVKGTGHELLVEGYALDITSISEYMADLEEQLEDGELSMKSNKKGQTIEFEIRWRKPKRKNRKSKN